MSDSLPKPVQDLIRDFSRLPGIGPKTAQRLAMHLLEAPESLSEDLARSIEALKKSTCLCRNCWHLTIQNPCSICTDVYRDRTILCVVEEPVDLVSIEKTGNYKGLYHVLHGHLSPIDGLGPDQLKIRELLARVQPLAGAAAQSVAIASDSMGEAPSTLEEVILATNPTLEGESTANYIAKLLKPFGVKVTRIARGLPSGGNIEYADDLTLTRAMEGRHLF
jgi:recombination protein RecR